MSWSDCSRSLWVLSAAALLTAAACTDDATSAEGPSTVGTETTSDSESGESDESETETDSGTDSSTDIDTETDTGEDECACAPGTDVIYIASKFGAVWTYDPLTNAFAEVGQITCGSGTVYTMAVDHEAQGWVLDLDTRDLIRIDLANPSNCTEPPWIPGNGGFNYFGMGFVSNDTVDVCEKLYLHSYSGDGPFTEGEGIGQLAVYDPADGSLETLSTIDYDGGEIDGTGDGRLFAFAGDDPAKLVEYDRDTGEVLEVFPLEGLPKTSASAFAFHSGDIYLFTEQIPTDCLECLDACTPEYQACLDDPVCSEALDCALEQGSISDECGGAATQGIHDCLANQCHDACFPIGGKLSQVTRLDWDESEGNGKVLEQVVETAPIRVVGAGTSICAPLQVP